jgi:hypothetical protein
MLSKPASANDAIYGVTVGEDSDDPCFFEVKYRDVATSATQSSLTFSECDGHKAGDLLTVTLPSGAFVTGARICLNSGGDKLKGIQLIGNYRDCVLGAESVLVAPSPCTPGHQSGHEFQLCDNDAPPYVERSCTVPVEPFKEQENCPGRSNDQPDEDWEKVVSCPNRMVATGMKLHTRDGSGRREMVDGVQLQCDMLVSGN